MADSFADRQTGLSDVGIHHFTIAPSDSADLPVRVRAIYCKADGTITVRDEGGTDVAYPMTAGAILPFRAVRVLATGTTGTYVGWY